MNINKILNVLIISFTAILSFGQSYKYNIELTENSKDAMVDMTKDIETYNRFVKADYITFESSENLDESYFELKCELYGYELISFSKTRGISSVSNEKAGTDCGNAEIICSTSSFAGNNSGFGTQELDASNNGCILGNENQSAWYYVNVNADGTLEMNISPDAVADYDFALWGPYDATTAAANCPPTEDPIRCNWADLPGGCMGDNSDNCADTGLDCAATNPSEGGMGATNSSCLNVLAGEVYILLIDNFSTSTVGYEVTWGGTSGLGCTPVVLPVELGEYTATKLNGYNEIYWSTLSENNNDYFLIEKSTDGVHWRKLSITSGSGTTQESNFYSVIDDDVGNVVNYYRLTQFDFDGTSKLHGIVAVDNRKDIKVIKTLNLMGQEVDKSYSGVVIDYYNDGSTRKRFNQ